MRSDWILNAIKHIRGGADFVAGPILPVVNPDRVPGFFSHQVDQGRQDLLCRTANMFYRRRVIEKLGGFDERFGVYPWGTPMAGEDTDLAWRARKNGYRFAWAEDAQVFHEASAMNLRDWLMEPFRMINIPMLVASTPELREVLLWRYFSSRENVVFYPALLGTIIAILVRQPFLLFLTLPWFWMKRSVITSDLGSPKRWWRIPVKYALLLERAVLSVSILIYSSVRYRSIVL
jgi:GT2 family glycosyltransferase